MKRSAPIIGVLAFLFFIVLFLYRGKSLPSPPPPPDPAPVTTEETASPPDRIPQILPEPKKARDRSELLALLKRLGRAMASGDVRTIQAIRQKPPILYRTDVPWLFEQIQGPLFPAMGSAALCAWHDLREAIPFLEEQLRTTRSFIRKLLLVQVLSSFGDDAGTILIAHLSIESDPTVRMHIVQALARSQNLSVRGALIQALRDPHPLVRQAAARALKNAEDLLDALSSEQDARTRAVLIHHAYIAGGRTITPRLREIVRSDPDLKKELLDQQRREGGERYLAVYPPEFFQAGLPPIPWNPTAESRIGITINLEESGGMTLAEAADRIFSPSPLDRYAPLFYLRESRALEEDLLADAPAPRAWDAAGHPLTDGLPLGPLDGTVYIRFHKPGSFGQNILGYTEGSEAHVTQVSLLHEFGHALARLADEYNAPAASDAGGANVDDPDADQPKWQSLVDQGHLPSKKYIRTNRRIPSKNCHMNNEMDDTRFCPVCQLEIIAQICAGSGASVPW